ncbi:MAG: recombination protein RecR [Candidatus Kerfeldbacteria bacterium]|nr:recombination protein RecR [Candidatus Kerfeldbacteria bacterium]
MVPPSIQRLIREFNKFPGIGSKTSERFVFHLLKQPRTEIEQLAQTLQDVKVKVHFCKECYTYTEQEVCEICRNPERNRAFLCVVAEPKDVLSIEQTGQFDGRYHVLGGVINHADGIGPEQLRMNELLERVEREHVQEVVIATNPDMEGETTAVYIAKRLEGKPVTVTRIARGLPVGADIEFADEVTLGSAMKARQKIL